MAPLREDFRLIDELRLPMVISACNVPSTIAVIKALLVIPAQWSANPVALASAVDV